MPVDATQKSSGSGAYVGGCEPGHLLGVGEALLSDGAVGAAAVGDDSEDGGVGGRRGSC